MKINNGGIEIVKFRFAALILLVAMIILFPSRFASAKSIFSDVTENYWAFHDIRYLNSKEIIAGYPDGSFRPYGSITRKEAALMMARSLKLSSTNPIPFKDLGESVLGYGEASAMVENGLFDAKDGNFYPDRFLTREEMAKALTVGFNLLGDGLSHYLDVPIGDPYYKYIDAIAGNGVTDGYTDGTFRPKDIVTRAQFSAFLSRIYDFPQEYNVTMGQANLETFKYLSDAIDFAMKNPGSTVHPVSNEFNTYSSDYLSPETTGINKGVLIYNGYEVDKNPIYKNIISGDFFKPYIAYSQNNTYIGKMFDSFIILGREYPSGTLTEGASNHANYSDWEWYIDKTFQPGGAVPLLNENVASIPIVDQVNVFLSIPYPKQKEDIVGLNGETIKNTLENRFAMVKWYIDQVSNIYSSEGLQHTQLKGFYWLNETVTNPQDEQLVEMTSDYLHSLGYKFNYSPHASATNFPNWSWYGFDGAFLQTNAQRVKFTDEEVQEMLHKTFIRGQIRQSGFNLEIENSGANDLNKMLSIFRQYLNFARMYGAQDTSLIVYQGVSMINRLGTNNGYEYQKMYDELYRFLNNQ